MEEKESLKITKVLNQSNIEVSRNSRGWTYSVKAYGDSMEDLSKNLKELIRIAKEVIEEESQ